MSDIQDQLAQLRRRIARIDRKYAKEGAAAGADPAPNPRKPRPDKYYCEEWLGGREVETDHGRHYEVDKLYERHRRLNEKHPEDSAAPIVGDYLFEKDKIFAYINLDNEELKLYERYFDMLTPSVPAPDLVIYLQAKPGVLRKRVSKKGDPSETQISPEYVEAVANAYEHFFFRYSASNLLVVNTSEIDFVNRNADLHQLLQRIEEPVKGTQYFLPLGDGD